MLSLFGVLDASTFLSAFAVGLIICYLVQPRPRVVVKFPNPLTADAVTYNDGSGASPSCYKYRAEKHSCPLDGSQVEPQPV